MALYVLKFGGSSMADSQRIESVANIIADYRKSGHDIVVAVSARMGDTDALIAAANEVSDHPHQREYDALLATGEQVSAALLSMRLQAQDIPAVSLNGLQAGIITSDHHSNADILKVDPSYIRGLLQDLKMPIIAGFQGVNQHGDTTTLGRGGSDLTAVAIAVALNADECRIYTDVDGIYSCDPRIVADAKKIETMNFEETLELASLGAKVLHRRAVSYAGQHNLPLRVLSSFQADQHHNKGTLITSECGERASIAGIAIDAHQAKILLNGCDDASYRIDLLKALSDARIAIDMLMFREDGRFGGVMSFIVAEIDQNAVIAVIEAMTDPLGDMEICTEIGLAKLSLVGIGVKCHAEVTSRLIRALQMAQIQVHLLAGTEIKISVLVDNESVSSGARALHQVFCCENNELPIYNQ